MLKLKVDAEVGGDIKADIKDARHIAVLLSVQVEFNANGVVFSVDKDTDVEEAYTQYLEDMKTHIANNTLPEALNTVIINQKVENQSGTLIGYQG